MLALHTNTEIISTHSENSWVKLPNGDMVSPAKDGWTNNTYTLTTILDPEEIPFDKISTGKIVDLVNNTPKYIYTLTDKIISTEEVNEERDRRISMNFYFNGERFDFDEKSKQRVTGAATLAGFALAAGAQANNYRWHEVGANSDFVWITSNNSLVAMDAPTCFAFGQAAAKHEKDHIFASAELKSMNPIPLDFAANNSYWPINE